MTEPDHPDQEKIKVLLQQAFPTQDTELRRDLWPAMLRKLDQAPVKVPWYDWALACGLALALVLFPKLFVFFAYHL